MNARFSLPVICVAVLLMVVPALAHHSFTTFWHMDQTAQITGVLKSVKIVNPHGEITVEVTEPNGETHLWYVTARGPAQATRRAGWENDSFVGEMVTVEGFPSRKEGARALAAGKVTFADGRVMWLGGGGGVPGQ